MRRFLAAAGFALALGTATIAHAIPILTYGDIGNQTNPFQVTRLVGSNTLTVVNDDILIVALDTLGFSPVSAFLNLSATSIGTATIVGTQVSQSFSGTYSITSGANGTGTNYLSGSFIDSLSGKIGGVGLTLSASTPPANSVTMTSDIIALNQLGLDRAMSFGITNLSAVVSVTGNRLNSTAGIVAGNFSAGINAIPVPEPGSLLVFGAGVLALIGFHYRRQRKV